jgi:PQQ-like domain
MRFRWALAALMFLTACSGGGSNNTPTVPLLAWGLYRHDQSNGAVGNGIGSNKADVSLLYATNDTTISTPAIDNKSQIYLGLRNGMVSLDDDGGVRWFADSCQLPSGEIIPFGPIQSSPTVTPGRDIVFGTDATATTRGMVFDLHERSRTVVECRWAFPTGTESVRSSAQVQVDPRDLSLLSVFIGTGQGALQAINGIGTPRWSFEPSPQRLPITSSNAIDPTGPFYITTPDGVLAAADASGRFLWQFPIGSPSFDVLQQSPGIGTSIYAVGAGSALFGINPGGTLKWQFLPDAEVHGSPTFSSQSIDVDSNLILDTVIYLADVDGEVYGVRDTDGQIWDIQYCSMPANPAPDKLETCRTDSCLPNMGECINNKCTEALNDMSCTPDTCKSNNHGACISRPAQVNVSTGAPVVVRNSPILSADLFVIVGTEDGQICARNVDGTVPGDDSDVDNPWLSGCIKLLDDPGPVLSSPAIGPGGSIFVTTERGLYLIK